MNDKRSVGSAILFTLIGTVVLSVIFSLSFFLICSKVFELGYRDDMLIKPLSFFISLSFLQALGCAIGFKTRRNILFWASIITTLASLVGLITGLLGCKGNLSEGVMPYATIGVVSVIVILATHFGIGIPAICNWFKNFFATLPEKRHEAKNKKIIDARNLHNAAEDEIIKKG